ncbi:MAG: lectin-like protein [Lachnospiraceae bacterium]
MRCKKCGRKLGRGEEFCIRCGTKAESNSAGSTALLSGVAIVISLLLIIAIAFGILKIAQLKSENGDSTKIEELVEDVDREGDSPADFNEESNEETSVIDTNTEMEHEKVPFGGHHYQLVDGDDVRWMEAKKKCEEQGGHLVTITSAQEQQFIQNFIADGNKVFYWIGATDSGQEPNHYYWVTGEEFSYQNWQEGQPDNGNWGPGEYEDYAGILRTDENRFGGKAYTWNDFRETPADSHGYICEWDD